MNKTAFTPGPWYIKQSEEIRLPYSINVSSTRITRITILDTPGGQYQRRHVIAQVAKGNGRGEANAAMIAAEGYIRYKAGDFADLTLNAKARVELG